MYRKTCSAWADLAMDSWTLGLEASSVIGLRLAKVASGGKAANDEIHLMVAEKVKSATQLQTRAASGQLGETPLAASREILDHYRGKVASNRRRLS